MAQAITADRPSAAVIKINARLEGDGENIVNETR